MHVHHPSQRTYAAAPSVAQQMGEAAANLLASLSSDQVARCVIDFDDESKRTFWHYTPIDRDGLPLTEMERHQRQLTLKLVSTGLSRAGFVTASTIMGIETALDAIEGWTRPLPGRDPSLYYITIFGRPDGKRLWGWKFEGHHISLNFTLADGRIIAPTPTFFGSNPAEASLGSVGALRPLGGIEDLARELMHSLDEAQRATALLASAAPPDIVTMNLAQVVFDASPMLDTAVHDPSAGDLNERARELGFTTQMLEKVRLTSESRGVSARAMSPAQREVLLSLVGEYIQRMPEELAEIEMAAISDLGVDQLHFAWAGGIERRQPHYYRLQGPRFLAEYDNTQNDANHIHSVWRDPHNDFGADLLAKHYATSHHH
ncbi:MAG: DUF3500 domain-containing protein [Caldilineaceae bacterium]|nr:DUF3500 domain-containing protein [Caldilineaceae bacterium]